MTFVLPSVKTLFIMFYIYIYFFFYLISEDEGKKLKHLSAYVPTTNTDCNHQYCNPTP